MPLTAEQQRFIDAFVRCGSRRTAAMLCAPRGDAKAAEAVRRSHYRWLAGEEYAKAFAEAKPLAADLLEDAGMDRAIKGWLEPVYQGGQLVGHVRKYDSGLLKFLLRGNMPDKYGDKVTQQHEGGVEVVVTYERTPTNRG